MGFAWGLTPLLMAAACGRFGFDNGSESSDAPPTSDVLGSETEDAPSTPNVMFATSTAHSGNLGGLAGADAICNDRASAAGLAGSYVAWLSTSTVDARSRLASARGWVRADGKAFADTVGDLAAGGIFYPPRIDEIGTVIPPDASAPTTTGTAPGGTRTAFTCADWTSSSGAQTRTAGLAYAGTKQWTDGWGGSCAEFQRLYCFGIDAQVPVAPAPTAGRILFVSTPWLPGGALADADAHCNADAAANQLPTTYRALLASSSGTAVSRFVIDSRPWVRPDGVTIAAAGRLSGMDLESAPTATAAGTHESTYVYTGASRPDSPADNSCSDWTSTSATAHLGWSPRANAGFFSAVSGLACNVARPLYCAEI